MNKFLIIFFSPLLFYFLIINTSVVFDKPGNYLMGDNLLETSTAIRISADRVYLDLNKNLITGGTDGIVIDPGVSNVTISNGLIASFQNNGIVVGENCKSILIQNIGIGLCAESAIALKGTSVNDKVSSITINNVVISQCALQTNTQVAVTLKYCDNILMQNSRIVENGNVITDISAVKIEQSEECIFLNVLMTSNKGKSITLFDIVDSSDCVFRDCNIGNNNSSNGDNIGFLVTGTSENNLFTRCNIVNHVATGGNVIGFHFYGSDSRTNDSNSCQVFQCEGNSVFGFKAENSSETLFNACNAVRNTAQGTDAQAIGFDIVNAQKGVIRNCITSFNTVTTGTATGIVLDGVSEFLIRDCSISGNVGTTDADSFGLTTTMGTHNGFIGNFAFDNGLMPANQFVGVPSGSVTQISASSLNTVAAPFTNLAVNS